MKAKYASIAIIITFGMLLSCGGPRRVAMNGDSDEQVLEPAPWDLIEDSDYIHGNPLPVAAPRDEDTTAAQDTLQADADAVAETPADAAPADSLPPIPEGRLSRYNGVGNLGALFNDSNKYSYAAAEKIGIRPVESLASAYYISRPLVPISTCQLYDVDKLTHSLPYLVPEAAELLNTIGRNFADSLKKRNAPGHRFRVTSLLRTSESVRKLRRVNRNATDSSTHKFGTTFDISYARFRYTGSGQRLSDTELKYILAEVLRDLRNEKRCMVKFERKTPCFHITSTSR